MWSCYVLVFICNWTGLCDLVTYCMIYCVKLLITITVKALDFNWSEHMWCQSWCSLYFFNNLRFISVTKYYVVTLSATYMTEVLE